MTDRIDQALRNDIARRSGGLSSVRGHWQWSAAGAAHKWRSRRCVGIGELDCVRLPKRSLAEIAIADSRRGHYTRERDAVALIFLLVIGKEKHFVFLDG